MSTTGLKYLKKYAGDKAYRSKWAQISDDKIIDIVSRYKTRSEWRKFDNGSYQEVHRCRKHLLSACTAHMERQGDPFGAGYQVYVYEFADRVAYIGLTCNPKRRYKDHTARGTVASKIKAGTAYVLKTVGTALMPTAASKLECATIVQYKADGWVALNRRHGGSTGQIRTKYTYQKLLELARLFKSRKQFEVAHRGAYQYACNHKLINQIADELGWPVHVGNKWTKDLCLQEAKKHRWLSDWSAAPGGSYAAAWKHGWLPKIKKLFKPKPSSYVIRWTKETCEKRAKDFVARADWQYQCKDGSYVTARRKGWLNEIADGVFGKHLNRWSRHVVK